MPLRFLLDEHMRGHPLWHAIRQHNARGVNALDVVRVGDPPDLPLGTPDPDILLWAEREDRVLISLDYSTLPNHLTDHLRNGRHSPGILLIRSNSSVSQVLAHLEVAAYAGNPADHQD